MTLGVGVQLSPFPSPLFQILTHPIIIQNIVMTLGDGSDFWCISKRQLMSENVFIVRVRGLGGLLTNLKYKPF